MFGVEGVGAHFGFIFGLGCLYGIFIYDFVVSIGLFASITKLTKSSGVLERYETLKVQFASSIKEREKKMHFHFKEGIHINNEQTAMMKEKIAEMIYIDPEKEKQRKDNYDESGRPIKEKADSK